MQILVSPFFISFLHLEHFTTSMKEVIISLIYKKFATVLSLIWFNHLDNCLRLVRKSFKPVYSLREWRNVKLWGSKKSSVSIKS